MRSNKIEFFKKLKNRFEEEFNYFCKELERKTYLINKTYQEVEITDNKTDNKTDIDNLGKAYTSLKDTFKKFIPELDKVINIIEANGQITPQDFGALKEYTESMQSQLDSMQKLIKNNLFNTKTEKLLLYVKAIYLSIFNFLVAVFNSDNLTIGEHVCIPHSDNSNKFDMPNVPKRTLPERPENSLFLVRYIQNCTKQFLQEEQEEQEDIINEELSHVPSGAAGFHR